MGRVRSLDTQLASKSQGAEPTVPLHSYRRAKRTLGSAPSEKYARILRLGDVSTGPALRGLSQLTPGGLQTVVLAAWALVLARLTDEEDVTFGVLLRPSVAGRALGTSSASQTHALGVHVGGQQSVLELMRAVARTCGALQRAPRLRGNAAPLDTEPQSFEVAIHVTSPELALADEARRAPDAKQGGTQRGSQAKAPLAGVPLQLTVKGTPELEVHAAYDTARFSARTVERWVDSLLATVARLARMAPDTPCSQVDVLSAAERRWLLYEFNATQRPFARNCCIQDRFEARAQLHPNQIAVETETEQLSYRELEQRANQLAHLLLERGCQSNQPVAVCMPRTADLVVALLAVVKAGALYIPLDPSYPQDRVRRIVEQAEPSMVITTRELACRFEMPTLQLDGHDAAALTGMPRTAPARQTQATDHCYVMFTSGTTGGPKGVLLSHRAVVNTLDWVNQTFDIGPTDRLLFVNTPCFDLSVYDVFGALGAGATVVVADETLLREPSQLASAVVDKQISIWNSAPAALQQLVEFFPASQPSKLRLVLLSGDWIPLTLPAALRCFHGVRVISLGGATEAAIWSNWFEVDRIDPNWTSIPYGKPIQNARYYVLNSQLEPVPTEVKGDLYIGGVCLADGYFQRPELTAERFIADPFCPGARLYKTGDLALHREDGNLELLGRSDLQVKIRGFRVELAEVEAALRAVPGVAQAVCEARTDVSHQKALIAHVVAEPNAVLDERGIRDCMARALPGYMLPSRILFHAAVPLSSNGKLDRARLCSATELGSPAACAEPTSSGTEQELVAMWQQLLGRRAIALTENFFEIGGHSLLAVMLVARIRERLGVEIPLAGVIEHPTIERLARSIEGAASLTPSGRHVHSYHPQGHRIPLVLIPGTLGTVFTFRSLPKLLGAEQPTHVVDFLGDYERSASNFDSIEAIAEYLEPEIIPLLHDGCAVLGGFSFGAAVAYELAARLRNKGHSIPLLISFDGQAPGHPKKLPLPQRMVALGRSLVQTYDGRALSKRMALVAERIKHLMLPASEPVPAAAAIDPELQRHLQAIGDAQYDAYERYAPTFRQDIDLLLVKARPSGESSHVHAETPDYGWSDYLDGAIATLSVPGEHLHLFDDGNLPTLAHAVEQRLARLRKDSGVPRSGLHGQAPATAARA